MNSEFMEGMQNARKAMLGAISDTDSRIVDIYQQAYQDLADMAGRQKDGSLTKRWQLDMSQSLEQRMRQLNGDVTATVLTFVQSAGKLPGKANADWLDLVLAKCGQPGSGDAFRSMLTRTSDEAIRQVVEGKAYLDSKSLSRRIWHNTQRARDGINAAIQQGIAQKKSAYELAKDLEQYVNPKAWKDYDWTKVYPDIPRWLQPINVEKHAQTLARTSINHAYHLAMVEAAEKNPFVSCIHWALSPQHYERQTLPFGADICDDYAYHDEGLGLGNWPIKNVPLPHPKCLCSQYAVVPQSLDKCADELKRWLGGEPNAALDSVFADWKAQNGAAGQSHPSSAPPQRQAAAKDQRTQAMEKIAQQPWAQAMKTPDREAVLDVLGNATQEELDFFARHGGMIKGDYYGGTGYYHPLKRSIHINIGKSDKRSKAMGYSTSDVRVFFHEIGHMFDFQISPGTRVHMELGQAFADQLQKDFVTHSNGVLQANGLPTINSLSRLSDAQKYALRKDLCQNSDLKNGISDIVGGMTGGRVEGWYGHKASYWKLQKPEMEMMAHMYEAKMMKGDKLKYMQEYFPDSYKMYEATLNKLSGGGTP